MDKLVPETANNKTGTTLRILLISVLVLVFGCVSAPIYEVKWFAVVPGENDPLSKIGSKKVSDFSELKLGVIFTDNTRKAIGYTQEIKSIHDSQKSGLMGLLADQNIVNEISKDTDANFLTTNLNKILVRTFKKVIVIGSLYDVEKEKLDLAMILDIRVDLGSFSFAKSTVDISGKFYDAKTVEIDNVVGSGEGTIPFPASHYAFRPAATSALNLFEHNLVGSMKLSQEALQIAKGNDNQQHAQTAKGHSAHKEQTRQSGTGSGFFVSKLGHVITNAHVVKGCRKVTVGDSANKQVSAEVVNVDKSNDLALLKLSSLEMASAESKSLIQKLSIVVVPLASKGLLRSDDVRLGEKVLVAGYPFGDIFSNTIKVTSGIVSATRGAGDDSGQFQLDAAVQPGNSGGPIYDSGGNIVGVVISQLDKMKMAKAIGSIPENVNFGIKASTVRQFLISSGLPSKKSERADEKSTEQLAEIAQNQALMVMCLQ